MLLRAEGALCVSIDCDDPPRSWHLKLEICIVRYRVESGKCDSPEQCMTAAAERDYIEDLLLAPEVIRGSEDHF